MGSAIAGTALPPSAVHALIEIGSHGSLPAAALCDALSLDKSSVSRMLGKLVAAGELEESTRPGDARLKPLALTAKGRATLAGIDAFANARVGAALGQLPPEARQAALHGLETYADALRASRTGVPAQPAITIAQGYRPGLLGRAADMHARSYARTSGFGSVFESKVAAGLAEFAGRLKHPVNGIWCALHAGSIVGTIAIDGEDMGAGIAHLRWFIVEDSLRGGGLGRRLLREALAFCDRHGFTETRLFTFRGLDAARTLYEAHGFRLAREWNGRQWGAEVMEQEFIRPG